MAQRRDAVATARDVDLRAAVTVEGDRLPRPDASCGITEARTARLTGQTSPGAHVVAQFGARVDATGAYSAFVTPGTYDVYALLPGEPTRLLIERDLEITADRTLDLPVATSGVEMPVVTPTVVGATGPVEVYADINTRRDQYLEFGRAPQGVPVPPLSMLHDDDQAAIGARSAGCTVQVPLTDEVPTLTMLAPFESQTDRAGVTWTADPGVPWEVTRLTLSARGTTSVDVTAFADTAWLEAAGRGDTLAMPDLAALPGWTAAGATIPAGANVDWAFAVMQGDLAASYRGCDASGSLVW